MTHPRSSPAGGVWEAIDAERRRDRFIKRVSVVAWSVTFTVAGILTVLTGISVTEMVKGALAGALPWFTVLGSAMPFIVMIGMLSVLIATLATIAMFLRQRTASLTEIQLRLAALEGLIAVGGTARSSEVPGSGTAP
jgi:hypothetical protein